MPTMPVSHFTWQVLRAVKRAKKKYPTGRELRLAPTRRTKDGTFLDELVKEGLLEVAGVDELTEGTRKWPAQFRTRYCLTEKGEYAAEYGDYERDVRRPEA